MEFRRSELLELQNYIQDVDKEVTMILQSLQWDREHLTKNAVMVTCKYDASHRIPFESRETHESTCYLKCQGYTREDDMLSEPLDVNAPNVVKLRKEDIERIINNASTSNPLFEKGSGWQDMEAFPVTAERLQSTYTMDERRALYDAVVNSVPSCQDLSDLALASNEGSGLGSGAGAGGAGGAGERARSRAEVLAQLRDMKRRRARYRGGAGAGAHANYSLVLRDLIKTQMELYSEMQSQSHTKVTSGVVDNTRTKPIEQHSNKLHSESEHSNEIGKNYKHTHNNHRHESRDRRSERRSRSRDKKIRGERSRYLDKDKPGSRERSRDNREYSSRDRSCDHDSMAGNRSERSYNSTSSCDRRRRDHDRRDRKECHPKGDKVVKYQRY